MRRLRVRYTLFEVTYAPMRFGSARPFNPEAFPAAKQFVLDGVRTGALKPVIAKTFAFDRIIEAHDYIENNQNLGRVVVHVI